MGPVGTAQAERGLRPVLTSEPPDGFKSSGVLSFRNRYSAAA